VKVLIVDDHPIVVSGVKALLATDADIDVLEAGSAEAAETIVAAAPPDVAVVDINLPGLSGFAFAQRVLDRDPAARIVMFSMNDDPVFIAQAMQIGAKGYISKNDNPAGMVSAIRTVADGGTCWPEGAEDRVAFLAEAHGNTGSTLLSPREREILRLLAKGRSLSEIADLTGVSYKTCAGTCAALRTRLGARTQMELVRVAIERKLV
jgi:DNA-binding NarL/FixJ family response regulator